MSEPSRRNKTVRGSSSHMPGNALAGSFSLWSRINRAWPPLVTGGVALASLVIGANSVLGALPAAGTARVAEAARTATAPLLESAPYSPSAAPLPGHRPAAQPSVGRAASPSPTGPQPSAPGDGQSGTDQQHQPLQTSAANQPPAAPQPDPVQQQVDAAAPRTDQLGDWINQALRVLVANGYPLQRMNPDDIRTVIQHESGGDPSAVNNADSNAAQGTPSKGLMQTIDPTFRTWALPGHGDIYDPVDNIIAGVRYSLATYGSLSKVPGVSGVRDGGSYQGY